MTNNIINNIKNARNASRELSFLEESFKEQLLLSLAKKLRDSCEIILQENAKDLALMDKNDPRYDRLLLNEARIKAIANDVETIAVFPPLNKILSEKVQPNGLKIQKRSVPLGVVAVIYESRPNVTVDVFSLCFKTGNACILKGGKEAYHSNNILVNIIISVLQDHDRNEHLIYLLPPEREAMFTLLKATGLVDVCIPRGGQALINFVRDNAKIPVIETGAGIVHAYFDVSGDKEKGRLIIDNAKTRRVSVCNALDSLIIHEQRLNDLWELIEPLAEKNVAIYADPKSFGALQAFYPKDLLHKATLQDFGQEFLSYKMSIKTVCSIEDAVFHIMHYTSGHSEIIIAEEDKAISFFLNQVDAAAVYANASSAFTDGGQFGMGAEIGISTQKLHARGPMGLEALTSYKWVVFGEGQIRP